MKRSGDRDAVPVKTPVKARKARSVYVMKPVIRPIEAREEAGQGSNLSTGTSEDRGGVSSEERSGLGRFLFV